VPICWAFHAQRANVGQLPHVQGEETCGEKISLWRSSSSSRDVRLTERFTRVGPERLQYEYTVTDPATWAQSWTARVFMRPTPGTGTIYEFACHEGNYAAELTLRSTRADEAAKGQ